MYIPRLVLALAVLITTFAGPARASGQSSSPAIAGPQPLQAAEGQPAKLAFEVASIHPHEKWKFSDPGYSLDSDDNFVTGQGQFTADGPLSLFIAFAYKLDMQHSMLGNLPKWANDRSYEIHATVPGRCRINWV